MSLEKWGARARPRLASSAWEGLGFYPQQRGAPLQAAGALVLGSQHRESASLLPLWLCSPSLWAGSSGEFRTAVSRHQG